VLGWSRKCWASEPIAKPRGKLSGSFDRAAANEIESTRLVAEMLGKGHDRGATREAVWIVDGAVADEIEDARLIGIKASQCLDRDVARESVWIADGALSDKFGGAWLITKILG
jgi:hypothetical protein